MQNNKKKKEEEDEVPAVNKTMNLKIWHVYPELVIL